jgi:hypothetical protein
MVQTRKSNAMALSDPQSLTINTVATSFPRISQGQGSGSFRTSDGVYQVDVNHIYGRRNRTQFRLTQTKTTADTLVPANNVIASASVILTVDAPKFGFTNTELKYLVDASSAFLAASSGAVVTKILGGES